MTLRLTPELLAAGYDYLRTAAPFKGWRLPESDDVIFLVMRDTNTWGHHTRRVRQPDSHEIGISERLTGTTLTLLNIMGHEMTHMAQDIAGTFTPNTKHNADFWKRARQVCRHHGWDEKAF